MLDLVAQVRQDQPRMGGKKRYYLLREQLVSQSIKLGRNVLFDLLAANNLPMRRRKRKTITTSSRHKFCKNLNMIKDLTPLLPNQVWVADITYWFTEGRLFVYLAAHRCLLASHYGLRRGRDNGYVHCRCALEMALR